MNVLEALDSVKKGNYIRYKDKADDVFFILQTTLDPLGHKSLVKIELESAGDNENLPKNLGELDYEELDSVCLSSIQSNDFEEVTLDEIMKEIQKEWRSCNE